MSRYLRPFLLIIFLIFFIGLPILKGTEPRLQGEKISLERVGTWQEPVWMQEKDGKIFIVEKGGKIIEKGKGVWLDISSRVRNEGEGGLLSLAFSPDRPNLFYVYYTDQSGNQRVDEGTVSPTPRLQRSVLLMEDFASNHNGGQILFGPGGLYIATGDGGGSGDPERTAQNSNSLLGKILRILPYQSGSTPYSIPPDNPFVGQSGKREEIFSLGLRNPWRFSIAEDRIWIADVGQNEEEEISAPTLQRASGGNFGWSAWEGKQPFNADQKAEDPIWPALVYQHGRRCSVTGGYLLPEGPLAGRYIYGDFCSGEIYSFRLEDGRARDDRSEGLRVPNLVSFYLSKDGEVWALSLGGDVYRLRW